MFKRFSEYVEMADLDEKAAKQLREITECPICMSSFNDSRMLPCIHSFCFECLNRTAESAEKKPGDRMPCPLCREDFFIPEDGINGLQKNFFMENLLEFKTTLQVGNAIIICDICNVRNEGKTGDMPKATMRCLECQDNYCDSCVKVHQFQKLSRNHQFVEIGSERASEMNRRFSTIHCSKHSQKPLDYYCADCKKIVCVSCFVESHASHTCKDVTSVDEEFRQTIQTNSSKISIYANEILCIRKNAETRKADFLKEIVDKENAIDKRNQELKEMIDYHTKLLLDELSVIKSKHLKEMEIRMEEIDRRCTILRSFEAYCTELISKGSASDICSSVDQLIVRADELEADHEAFIGRPHQSGEVSFQATDLREISQKYNNFLGQIREVTSQSDNAVGVVGMNDDLTTARDTVEADLHRSNERQRQIPTTMTSEAVDGVGLYCNTIYVHGKLEDELAESKQEILRLQNQLRLHESSSPPLVRRPWVCTQEDCEKFKEKLMLLSITGRSLDIVMQYVNIYSCHDGDVTLFIWNAEMRHYLAYLATDGPEHLLHADCVALIDSLDPDLKETGKWIIAEVVSRDFCLAKKVNNRFRVPIGTKFYRVKIKPWAAAGDNYPKALAGEDQLKQKSDLDETPNEDQSTFL